MCDERSECVLTRVQVVLQREEEGDDLASVVVMERWEDLQAELCEDLREGLVVHAWLVHLGLEDLLLDDLSEDDVLLPVGLVKVPLAEVLSEGLCLGHPLCCVEELEPGDVEDEADVVGVAVVLAVVLEDLEGELAAEDLGEVDLALLDCVEGCEGDICLLAADEDGEDAEELHALDVALLERLELLEAVVVHLLEVVKVGDCEHADVADLILGHGAALLALHLLGDADLLLLLLLAAGAGAAAVAAAARAPAVEAVVAAAVAAAVVAAHVHVVGGRDRRRLVDVGRRERRALPVDAAVGLQRVRRRREHALRRRDRPARRRRRRHLRPRLLLLGERRGREHALQLAQVAQDVQLDVRKAQREHDHHRHEEPDRDAQTQLRVHVLQLALDLQAEHGAHLVRSVPVVQRYVREGDAVAVPVRLEALGADAVGLVLAHTGPHGLVHRTRDGHGVHVDANTPLLLDDLLDLFRERFVVPR